MTPEELYERGMELARQQKLGDAFIALEECVTLDPDHGAACKELARLSLLANEVRAFTNWLHEAQRINGADPEPHVMLAEHLAQKRRWEEASFELMLAGRKRPSPELAQRIDAVRSQLPDRF